MNKLERLLHALSASEAAQFQQALDSPWFNQQPETALLFRYLWTRTDQSNVLNSHSIESLAQAFYPNEKSPFVKTRHLSSALCGKLEDFWVLRQARNNGLLRSALLDQALSQRALGKDRLQALSLARRKWSSREEQLNAALMLAEARYEVAEQVRSPENSKHLHLAASLSEQLARHKRIKYACEDINRSAILASEEAERIDIPEQREWDDVTDMAYLQVYSIIREQAYLPDRHKELASTLQESEHEIAIKDSKALFEFSINIAIRVVNQGHPDYLSELFNTYQKALKLELLTDSRGFSMQHFKNIVTTGLRLKELSWIDQFIKRHGKSLAVDNKVAVLDFYQAQLSFERQDYSRAIRLLFRHHFDDPFYQLGARALQAKAYYELDDREPLRGLIESLRAYLGRNKKVSTRQRNNYLNFCKAMRKLLQWKEDGGVQKLERGIAWLDKLEQLAERPWLQHKLRLLLD